MPSKAYEKIQLGPVFKIALACVKIAIQLNSNIFIGIRKAFRRTLCCERTEIDLIMSIGLSTNFDQISPETLVSRWHSINLKRFKASRDIN